jgi:NADPH:quinone reductase
VPGIEVAGHIRAVGDGVSGLAAGQPAAALTIVDSGGYAEVAVTDARLVAPLPDDADEQALARAASACSNTTTAILVMDQVARLQPSERVLVHAAAGGVGSQLGQAARLFGAGLVAGTVGSPAKLEAARALGYDHVLVRDQLAEEAGALTGGTGFDVVVDPVGGATRRASLDALALGGRLVVMGNASGASDVAFSANELWFSGKGVLGFNLAAFSAAHPDRAGRALRRAIDAVLAGRLRVDVRAVLPLSDAAEAHRRIESGGSTGKAMSATPSRVIAQRQCHTIPTSITRARACRSASGSMTMAMPGPPGENPRSWRCAAAASRRSWRPRPRAPAAACCCS